MWGSRGHPMWPRARQGELVIGVSKKTRHLRLMAWFILFPEMLPSARCRVLDCAKKGCHQYLSLLVLVQVCIEGAGHHCTNYDKQICQVWWWHRGAVQSSAQDVLAKNCHQEPVEECHDVVKTVSVPVPGVPALPQVAQRAPLPLCDRCPGCSQVDVLSHSWSGSLGHLHCLVEKTTNKLYFPGRVSLPEEATEQTMGVRRWRENLKLLIIPLGLE